MYSVSLKKKEIVEFPEIRSRRRDMSISRERKIKMHRSSISTVARRRRRRPSVLRVDVSDRNNTNLMMNSLTSPKKDYQVYLQKSEERFREICRNLPEKELERFHHQFPKTGFSCYEFCYEFLRLLTRSTCIIDTSRDLVQMCLQVFQKAHDPLTQKLNFSHFLSHITSINSKASLPSTIYRLSISSDSKTRSWATRTRSIKHLVCDLSLDLVFLHETPLKRLTVCNASSLKVLRRVAVVPCQISALFVLSNVSYARRGYHPAYTGSGILLSTSLSLFWYRLPYSFRSGIAPDHHLMLEDRLIVKDVQLCFVQIPSRHLLVSGARDGSLSLYDLSPLNDTQTFHPSPIIFETAHSAPLTQLAYDVNLHLLFSSSYDGTLKTWRLSETSNHFEFHKIVAYHKLGIAAFVYFPQTLSLVTTSHDHNVCVWSLRVRHPVTSVTAHSAPITSLVSLPNTSLVLTLDTQGVVKMWETSTMQCVQITHLPSTSPTTIINLSKSIRSKMSFLVSYPTRRDLVRITTSITSSIPSSMHQDTADVMHIAYDSESLQLVLCTSQYLRFRNLLNHSQTLVHFPDEIVDLTCIHIDFSHQIAYIGTNQGTIWKMSCSLDQTIATRGVAIFQTPKPTRIHWISLLSTSSSLLCLTRHTNQIYRIDLTSSSFLTCSYAILPDSSCTARNASETLLVNGGTRSHLQSFDLHTNTPLRTLCLDTSCTITFVLFLTDHLLAVLTDTGHIHLVLLRRQPAKLVHLTRIETSSQDPLLCASFASSVQLLYVCTITGRLYPIDVEAIVDLSNVFAELDDRHVRRLAKSEDIVQEYAASGETLMISLPEQDLPTREIRFMEWVPDYGIRGRLLVVGAQLRHVWLVGVRGEQSYHIEKVEKSDLPLNLYPRVRVLNSKIAEIQTYITQRNDSKEMH